MIELYESKTPMGMKLNPDLNICIVKENSETGDKTWYYTHNIVTNDGDLYYAQKAVGETPTSDFGGTSGRMELRTGSATPAKGDTYAQVATPVAASRKAIDSNYPKTNDGDSDNTGAGTDIVTWRTSWTTSDFNSSAIIGGCIHVGAASPASGTKVLTHFSITSFDKTSSDTLKIFVNHTFNGT
tara:strand:+ start:914 stop:1465 length:552 start_codon:yes stop_codon:yes gene_type:complete